MPGGRPSRSPRTRPSQWPGRLHRQYPLQRLALRHLLNRLQHQLLDQNQLHQLETRACSPTTSLVIFRRPLQRPTADDSGMRKVECRAPPADRLRSLGGQRQHLPLLAEVTTVPSHGDVGTSRMQSRLTQSTNLIGMTGKARRTLLGQSRCLGQS